ncbi:MAG TPA: NADP-dependent oxidoreductase [Pseudolysinimonas sp.]|nr:NADP-dependent oxidoreductase [Pseudolysinimonas sp.]
MSWRVVFRSLGGPEVLEIEDVPEPHAGPGQVRVAVTVMGLNPFDFKRFGGLPTSSGQAVALPAGNGSDFAGTVDEVGEGVTGFTVGDEVWGGWIGHAQAEYLVIDPAKLNRRPEGLPVEVAGALFTVSGTAWASVASLGLTADDTVLVSAAAGGVGLLAVQLARRTGATVIGTAGPDNQEFVKSLGAIPVVYGEGAADRVRAVAPSPVTAALDNQGRESVDLAISLGVPGNRINSIADYAAPADFGASLVGSSGASDDDRRAVADLIARGEVRLPIDSTYRFDEVQQAYAHLLGRHVRGKVVLTSQ